MPVAWPWVMQVPGVGHRGTVAQGRLDRNRIRAFSTGSDSPVSAASGTKRMDEAQIGGYPIARLQKHQIAGHQLFGWHRQALAAADRYGLWREHVPDGIQRPLGLAFLDKAEHRVDHDDAKDHSRVDPVRQRGRDAAAPSRT